MVFEDYYALISKIVKYSFLRTGKTSAPYVKTYLHNVLSLETNLKKFDMVRDYSSNCLISLDKRTPWSKGGEISQDKEILKSLLVRRRRHAKLCESKIFEISFTL